MNGIMYVRPGGGFKPSFPLTQMMEVNGYHQHQLYSYLKNYCPPIDYFFRPSLFYEPLIINDVHWNFEKFLVGRDGKIVSRYHPKVMPIDIRDDIVAELAKPDPFASSKGQATSAQHQGGASGVIIG